MALTFTLVIDGQTVITTQNYGQFIQEIRNRVQDTTLRNRPVLIPEVNRPTRFFEVIIAYGNSSARFRLRFDNLYLIGFLVESGRWWAFSDATTLFNEPETRPLRFDGSYRELLGQISSKTSLTSIEIGSPSLQNNLPDFIKEVKAEKPNWSAVARFLIVVIMMICESARFTEISEFIHNSIYHPASVDVIPNTSFQIRPWMVDLAKNWGSLSAAVIDGTANPTVTFPMNHIELPGGRLVASVLAALELLGIIKFFCFRRNDKQRLLAMNEEQCFSGIPLLEVFSLRINNIDNENPGELYGTITISNGLYPQFIYNRTSNNPESIKSGQYASLNGPSEAISAFGSITMKSLLTDYDLISSDDVIIDEETSLWREYDMGRVYDKHIAKEIRGGRGSVTVNYAVLRNAMAARVSITLKEASAWRTNQVYGQVSAHYDKWDDPAATFWLFNRERSDYVNVNRGHDIPLLRSMFAVPLGNSLKITALLHYPIIHDETRAGSVTSSNASATTVEFPVPEQLPHTMAHEIKGERDYSVLVKVVWASGF